MELRELFATADAVAEYREWLKDPRTQRVVETLKHYTRPLRLGGPGAFQASSLAEQGLACHAYNLGQTDLLQLMSGLEETHAQMLKTEKLRRTPLVADYADAPRQKAIKASA